MTPKVSKCFCSISVLSSHGLVAICRPAINKQTGSPGCHYLICRRDLSSSSQLEGKQNPTHYRQVSYFLFPGLYSLLTSQLTLESPTTHLLCLSFLFMHLFNKHFLTASMFLVHERTWEPVVNKTDLVTAPMYNSW